MNPARYGTYSGWERFCVACKEGCDTYSTTRTEWLKDLRTRRTSYKSVCCKAGSSIRRQREVHV